MAFGKIGQTLSALEIFDLVRADLEKVEREIGLESVASVEAINHNTNFPSIGSVVARTCGPRVPQRFAELRLDDREMCDSLACG